MRRWLSLHTLHGRLTLLACFATLPAFLFVVYLAANDRAEALRRAEINARYLAETASREHVYQVKGAQQLLGRLAAMPWMDNADPDAMSRLLPIILQGFPQFANLGALKPDGELLYSVVPPPRHINMTDIPAFQQALDSQDVAVGSYLIGRIVERPILIMTQVLRDAPKSPRLVLFAALDLDWLDRLAKQAGLPPDTTLLIVDRNGTILANSQTKMQPRTDARQLQGFQQLRRNPQTMAPATTPDGLVRLVVASPLEGLEDIWVVVGTPEKTVYAMANAVFFRDLMVLGLLTLVAIVCALIATDFSVLRDIRSLAATTRRFGSGNLDARAPIPRPKGEIRDLTIAFNTMAATLSMQNQESIAAQERLRALTHRMQRMREEESARIAQELHDELGQELSILRLELERLHQKMTRNESELDLDALAAAINEMGQYADHAVRSVRRIASELRPSVLDRLGLEAGLEWLLTEFERRTGIATTLLCNHVEKSINPDIATALFRITQEGLTNIAKHAGASSVMARLVSEKDKLVLIIKDDGRGFDPDAENPAPSLGLLGMKERARRLNGTVTIKSAKDQGVELKVEIPIMIPPHEESRP